MVHFWVTLNCTTPYRQQRTQAKQEAHFTNNQPNHATKEENNSTIQKYDHDSSQKGNKESSVPY